MKTGPCKNCEFRHPLCWGTCKVYEAWKDDLKLERAKTNEANAALNTMYSYGGKKRKR